MQRPQQVAAVLEARGGTTSHVAAGGHVGGVPSGGLGEALVGDPFSVSADVVDAGG